MGTGSQGLTQIRRVLTQQLGTLNPILRFFYLTDDSVKIIGGRGGRC